MRLLGLSCSLGKGKRKSLATMARHLRITPAASILAALGIDAQGYRQIKTTSTHVREVQRRSFSLESGDEGSTLQIRIGAISFCQELSKSGGCKSGGESTLLIDFSHAL